MMSHTEIFTQLKQRLSVLLPEDATVTLFGSQARGDYSEDSDWDLLVILHRPGSVGISELGDILLPIYELGAELGIDISPIVYTVNDWDKRRFTPFYKNAVADGVRLWD